MTHFSWALSLPQSFRLLRVPTVLITHDASYNTTGAAFPWFCYTSALSLFLLYFSPCFFIYSNYQQFRA